VTRRVHRSAISGPEALRGCANDAPDDEAPSWTERREDALRGLQRILEDMPTGVTIEAQAVAALLALAIA
jgi:hypothetical protein